jgi:hypothetical protein
MATAQYAKKQIMILAGEKMPNIPMGQPQIQGQQAGGQAPMGGQTEQVMATQPGGQE